MIQAVLLSWLLSARAPDLAFVHTPPTEVNVTERAVEIRGKLTGASEIERVELKWRLNDGTWRTAELDPLQGDEYAVRLEGPPVSTTNGTLDYYIIAYDFLGKSYEVYANSKKPEHIKLVGLKAAVAPQASGPTLVQMKPEPELPSSMPTEPAQMMSHTRLDHDRIVQSGASSLIELLMLIPEIFVSRSSDGAYRLSTAGRRDDVATRLFIDGVEMNSLNRGDADWTLPAVIIESVNVVLSDFDATAASIPLLRVEVMTSRQPVNARVLAGGYASHLSAAGSKTVGTYDVGVAGGGQTGALSLRGRAALQYSGGSQRIVAEDALSGVGGSLTPGTTRDRSLRLVVGGTFDGQIAPGHVLGLDTNLIFSDRDNYVGPYDLFTPLGARQRADLATQLYAIGKVGVFDYDTRLIHRLHTSRAATDLTPGGYVSTDVFGQSVAFTTPVSERRKSDEHVLTARGLFALTLPMQHRLRALLSFDQHIATAFSVERNFDASLAPTTTFGVQDFPVAPASSLRRSALTLAMADTFAPLAWLDVNVGVRFVLASDLGVRASDTGNVLTPVVSLTFKPLTDLAIRVGYDTGVRAATTTERHDLAPFEDRGIRGNPLLRYSVQRVASMDISYTGTAAFFRYLTELRTFWNGARGQPFVQDDGVSVASIAEGQDIDTFGVSLFGKLSFGQRSYLGCGTSWHRATARAGTGPRSLLTDAPQLSAVMHTNIELGRFADLFVSATYYGERRNNARTIGEEQRAFTIAAATVVSVTVRSMAFYGLRAILTGSNVFDENRRDDLARVDRLPGLIPREGMRVLAGLEYALPGGTP